MDNKKNQIITAFHEVGKSLKCIAENKPYDEVNKIIDEEFWIRFNQAIQYEKNYNGWFIEKNIRQRLLEVSEMLSKSSLTEWTADYSFSEKPNNVGIIMAGNIPLVGFHDYLSVMLSGNNAIIKMSSDDKHLFPLIIELTAYFLPEIKEKVDLSANFKKIDAMLATGSDNSALYFEKYFGHLPCLIRNNRTSLAVLKGDESEQQLNRLGSDVFDYFGMGCRNVSQLFVPKDYDLDKVFKAFYPYKWVIDHKKYANNYDYYKAIYLMNQMDITENGFLLTKTSDDLFAPVAVLNINEYNSENEVNDFLTKNKNRIQAIVGDDHTSFGRAQKPKLDDYADGENTLEFLTEKL